MIKIKSNLWKISLYKFLSDFWLIGPVLIPFYRSNGLDTTQVYIVQSIYLATIVIFEIPSGYLADVIGRKKTLIIGAFFLPIGLGIYAISSNFTQFALAEFILAIAASMRSGCDSAVIFDTLTQINKESEYKLYEGKALYYQRIGTSISSISGGLFALITLRLPFYINIISGLVLVIISFLIIEPERKKHASEKPLSDIIKIIRYCITHPEIRYLVLLSSLLLSTGIIGVWSYYIYYEELGLSIGINGILFAIFGIFSALGSRQAHNLENFFGKKNSLYILSIISFTYVALGLFKSIFLISFIFINGFLWGFSAPLLLDYINRTVKSDIRATVLSVSNMAGSLFFVLLSPIFGLLVDSLSLSGSYIILGIYFFIFCILYVFLFTGSRIITSNVKN